MPIVVACPKCKAKYNLPDHLLGKPVQCKACDARFQVGQPQKALATRGKAGAVVASSLSPQQQAEMNRLGVQGPLKSRPDLFAGGPISPADPLANHVIEDPGFSEDVANSVDDEAAQPGEDNEFAAMFDNPAISQPKETKSKVDPLAQYLTDDYEEDLGSSIKARKRPSHETLWIKMSLVLPVFVLGFVLSFFTREVSIAVLGGGCVILAIVQLWLLVYGARLVSKNTGNTGLAVLAFIFLPYQLYCSIVYWSKPHPMKWFVLAFCSFFVVSGIATGLVIAALTLNLPGLFEA